MTTLVMAGIFIFGAMAYRLLPVSDLPNVDFPTIQVTAALPGASPETMASSVATPLERQFSTIAGLDSMSSSSTLGNTMVVLQFTLSRNLDAAAQDVQAAISRAARDLPQDMPSPPAYQKVNPADQPILYIALTSPTLPPYSLHEYGDTVMAQRISMVSGVAQVLIYGAQKFAVRVQVDPRALSTRGIGIDEVSSAIRSGNTNLPTGVLYGPEKAFTVEDNGQLMMGDSYMPLIVTYRNGNPVRIRDIGRAINSVENDKTAAWYVDPGLSLNQRAIILAIQRQPGTNTVEVAQAVKNLLPTFRMQLPASVSMQILYDRSVSIQASVGDVKFTLVLTLFLVVLVIFLFLRNLRATLIPSLSMPMSIVGTFSVMHLLGYSLDNLSLMALILSMGFVVDDAIVMLENVYRHMEMGEKPLPATLRGSGEISFTIVSMTLSLAAVFIPVIFMGGILGRLFHEFAVTIGVAVLVSGFVSLTLTPMLCGRFLRPPQTLHHGHLYAASEAIFKAIIRAYGWSLKWIFRHRPATMIASGIVLVLSIYLFGLIPKGFIPSEDTSQVFTFTEAAQDISFEAMVRHQKEVAAVIEKDPNVRAFMFSVGARGGITSSNTGVLLINLKPRKERKLNVDQIIEEFRPKLSRIPGITVFMQNLPLIRIGGRLLKSQYQYTLQGPDTKELYYYAPFLEAKMRDLPGIQDVTTDLQFKNLQIYVNIDRDKASALGITAQQIEDALQNAYASNQVSTIFAPNNQYKVILELLPQYQRDPSALRMLYVRSSSGKLAPLDTLAALTPTLGPLTVNHTGQLPSVTLSFNLKPGTSLGDAVTAVDKLARTTLPATISTSFQGTAQAFQSSMQGLGLLLLMAVLVIYLVLGILYESFIHPLTILSALPFAGFGALVTLMAFNTELSIYAFVGIIMLIGLVKKNGIMMIDFAIAARKNQDKTPMEAIYDACLIRFRPIMMTTMAALMGTLPIALGYGAGGESRRPLGLAVVGGLLFSQLLTLYATPVFYTYMESLQEKLSKRVRAQSPESESQLAIEKAE
jgi:HAE1 family hydrophobic/amphiphilic exporter-1